MTRPSWIGYTLGGRYQIEALLGQGGMSAVYRARDPNLRRSVAVKLIHTHLSNDPEFVRRFESEAAAIAQLRHPNIVQVYDFDHDGDVYYMIMEFLPGESLQERLKTLNAAGERMPVGQAAALMGTVADAVAYAHSHNMIHRDLKPANVMLMANGQPVLTDFGVAKILGAQAHTATGAVIGTPMYMSPEQVQGQPQDGRTDIYSMGIMLYEIATGRPPYEGDSAITIMLKQVNEPVPDVRLRAADVPPALKAVVDRSLAKRPEDRFQTAGEMSAALRSFAQQPNAAPPTAAPPVPYQQPTVNLASEDEPTALDTHAGAMGRTMVEEATSPMPQPVRAVPPAPVPPTPVRPAQRDTTFEPRQPAEAPPPPRREQMGTIVVDQPSPQPRERAAWEHEPVQPLPRTPAPRRSPLGLILGVGTFLLVCLVIGALAAVLGGPPLMNALFGGATEPATEAAATSTVEAEDTVIPPTDAPTEEPTLAPTDAPTEVPSETPTPEPTAITVPPGMALLPAGTFAMGAASGDSAPVHDVALDAFFLDEFEVTNQRYQACVDAGACTLPASRSSFTRAGYFSDPAFSQYPVVNVSWDQAQAFCAFEGKRLPTEAEWEYAAGSARSQPYPWGAGFDASRTTVTAGDTQPVGSFAAGASTQGIHDMAGNVLEWVADWYQSDYYLESPASNPPGPAAGTQKVMRGGSFGNPDPTVYLSTRRFRRAPQSGDVDIGFRCAQTAP